MLGAEDSTAVSGAEDSTTVSGAEDSPVAEEEITVKPEQQKDIDKVLFIFIFSALT